MTLIVGAAALGIADYFGKISVTTAFHAQLRQQLMNRAADDRFRFSRYVYRYREAAKVFASQRNIFDYVNTIGWEKNKRPRLITHTRPPKWFARKSIQRALVSPRITLLLDRWGGLREIYYNRSVPLPEGLSPPPERLLQLSQNENYLTAFPEGLFLVTSQTINTDPGKPLATLVLASPIDQAFLLASQQTFSKGYQVALVSEEIPQDEGARTEIIDPLRDIPLRILVSSDMAQLPKGTLLNNLPGHLLVSQQEFYEYGASEMGFRFVTLVSTDLIEPQIKKVIKDYRIRTLVQACLLLSAFAGIMILLTRRIETLSRRVMDFSDKTLERQLVRERSGDQLKMLENQFQKLTRAIKLRTGELKSANTELKDFAHVVSHDLKAPLRAINQLASWLAEDYADVLDEQGKEQLELMMARAERMHAMIDGILEYSRIGRSYEKKKLTDLTPLVTEVIHTLSPPAHIRIDLENELPRIFCEAVRLEQVFLNLIGNAVKFMDKPRGRIQVGSKDRGSHWEFTVTDNGPGIEESLHDKAFQIFQTLVPRDRQESTGVGLSIVKKIVELHQGDIRIQSDPGKGTTFIFTIIKEQQIPGEKGP
ncbi:MAG: ATP-binding protein [Desulfobacterales bacterium]|nr:ATP-binding protein [Desulfobacterales bacterium]